jgi:hypothetical protein
MAQNVEAIAVRIDCKIAEIAKANAKRTGRVDPNNLTEWAGNGRPKDRVDSDGGPDDQAGNKCPKMRSTKMPTRSGHSFSIETINKDVSSRDDFSVAMERRLGVPARTMTSRTRRRERPSGHAQLEQQLGGEDRAGIVCWQKPPGCTGICRRHCRFFTGRCNERRRCSLARRLTGRSQLHPASKALSDSCMRRVQKSVKRLEGPGMMAWLLC